MSSSPVEELSRAIDHVAARLRRWSGPLLEARSEVQRVRRLSMIDGRLTDSASVELSGLSLRRNTSRPLFVAASRIEDAFAALAGAPAAGDACPLAPRPPMVDHHDLAPLDLLTPLHKVHAALHEYHELARTASSDIERFRAFYVERQRLTWYGASDGASIVQRFSDASLIITLEARRLDRSGFTFVSRSRPSGRDLLACHEQVRERAATAGALTRVREADAAPAAVVLDPGMSGVLAHEAIGHLSEADYLLERPEVAELMRAGRPIASPLVTVIDDPSLSGRRGSYRYDDEGSPARLATIIAAGCLRERLHSRATAAALGAGWSAHARAIDFRRPPLVRMSNTFIAPGDIDPRDILADVAAGLYLATPMGGETEIDRFSLAANDVWRIDHGRLTERLGPAMLVGSLVETLHRVDAVGNDLCFEGSAGGCAKEEQTELPVDDGGPHLRIREAMVVPL